MKPVVVASIVVGALALVACIVVVCVIKYYDANPGYLSTSGPLSEAGKPTW